MGVIIAVTIEPNGAGFVVIPERYPLQGARSSRLTVARTRNPATGRPCTKRLTWARGYPRQPLSLGHRLAVPERYKRASWLAGRAPGQDQGRGRGGGPRPGPDGPGLRAAHAGAG